MFELRRYQQEALDKVKWAMSLPGNDLISLPTGSGKSLIIAEILNYLDTDVLIFQPSKEILEQNVEKLKHYVPEEDIGIFSASMGEKTIKKYTFATIGSVYKCPELFKQFKIVIADEAHLINFKDKGTMYTSFLKSIGAKLIGLTATIYRNVMSYHRFDDGYIEMKQTLKLINRMQPFFWKRLLYSVDPSDLIDQGYLCPLEYEFRTFIPHDEIELNKSESDFNLESYEKQLGSRQLQVVEAVEELPYNSILVFCSSVSQAETLSSVTPDSAVVSAKTPKKERAKLISDFKSGDIRTVYNVNCLSDDTEILTLNKGWVSKDQIEFTDLVAQYDQYTGEITFINPSNIIHNIKKTQDMVEMVGRYTNFSVTPNHQMLYKTGSNLEYRKTEAKNLVDKNFIFPTAGTGEPIIVEPTQQTIPNKSRIVATNSYNYRRRGYSKEESKRMAISLYEQRKSETYKNPSELTLDDCKFIGFWLGDGSKWKDVSGGNRFSLSQADTNWKIQNWIEDLLHRLNINYTEYHVKTTNSKTYSLSKGTGGNKQRVSGLNYLLPYLQKDGTDLFWGLNREQFIALLEGFHAADGNHGNYNKLFDVPSQIFNTNKKLLDLLQAIGSCRGLTLSISSYKQRQRYKRLYKLSISNKVFHKATNVVPKLVRKEESTWCVTVPKGNIVTRRNGKVTIMGNCLTTGFDFPELECIILIRPTRSVALLYQMIGRGLRTAPGKKSCKVIDYSGSILEIGRIETFELVKDDDNKWNLQTETGLWHNKILYSHSINKPKITGGKWV